MINLSPFSFLSSIAKTKSTDINNPINKTKILLQQQISVSLLNLYRAYTYNLSIGCNQKPLSIVRNLITTTQKIFNKRKKILFYPDFPYRKATLYQICLFLGYDVTNNSKEKFDLVIKWQRYKTFFSEEPILSRLSKQNFDVINFHCQDVSKLLTNQLFDEAFGYSITVNPLTYTGKCVVKSNLNAQHDGRIISCPTEKIEPEVVYQKLVDNEIEEEKVLEYRVPVFSQKIPCVYIYIKKNKTETQRFFGYPSLISVEVAETKEIFDEDEIRKILSFCQKLGLDYGELDILRDKIDKRIYIVDANNTPSSRLLFEPLVLPLEKCILAPKDRQLALQKMAEIFQKEFFNIDKSEITPP